MNFLAEFKFFVFKAWPKLAVKLKDEKSLFLSPILVKKGVSFCFSKVCSTTCWEKVGADIFENCNQKCQEGVSSKTHYQGMDIIQCRLLKTSKCVS
jgi:hypothetical protein